MALAKTYSIISAKTNPANGLVRLVEFEITITDSRYPGASTVHSGLIDIGFAQLTLQSPADRYIDAINSNFASQQAMLDANYAEQLAWQALSNSLDHGVPNVAPEPTTDMINQERNRRIAAGAKLNIPGYGKIAMQGRDVDQINLNARATAANLKLATGDKSIMIFRDAANVDHELTPAQMIAVFAIGSAWVESQYKASWAIKAMTPVPANFTDDEFWAS